MFMKIQIDLTTIVDINYFYSIVNCDKKCYIIFVKIFTKNKKCNILILT